MEALAQKEKGFTLIEALVSTFLFAIVMVSAVGIYLSTVQLTRRADSNRLAVQTSRYMEEFISKEVRNGQIDYNGPRNAVCGSFPTNGVNYDLAIVNVDGDHECFYLGDNLGNASSSGTDLWVIKNNLSAVKLNPANISFPLFKVYVSPVTNPYCNNPPACTNIGSNVQPRITILSSVQSFPNQPQSTTIPLQFTISTTVYDIP